jgi:thioester reductase-like protein
MTPRSTMTPFHLTRSLTNPSIPFITLKPQTSSTTTHSGEAGADAEGDASLDASVFHTKAEMNSMLASSFATPPPQASGARSSSSSSVMGGLADGGLVPCVGVGMGKGKGQAILLYGADSLGGAHLLRYLLKGTSRRRLLPGGAPVVYCLGSWSTAEGGLARIEKVMREAKIWKPAFAARIRPLPGGDATQARFRLPPAVYARLAAEVGTIVHAGSPLLWALDAPLVAENVSALMNMVALARANGASVHYVSSQWLDGYDGADPETDDRRLLASLPEIQVKRRAEEILHFAAHQHGLRCAAYRLPCLAVNTKGGFSRRHARDESFVVKTIAILRDAGMLVAECADDVVPLISADVAAKFVVARILGARGRNGRRRAAVFSPTVETECVTMSTLVDWMEEAEGCGAGPINRVGTREEMAAYFERRIRLPPMVETYSRLFFEVMPALSRTTRRLVAAARAEVTPLQALLYQAKAKRRGGQGVTAAEGMHRFIVGDPSLIASALAMPGGEALGAPTEEEVEEGWEMVEAADAGSNDASTASEGSTSESEAEERDPLAVAKRAAAKAKAKAAAVAGGGEGVSAKQEASALTLSQ